MFGDLDFEGLTIQSDLGTQSFLERMRSVIESICKLNYAKNQHLAIGGITQLKRNGLAVRMMAQSTQLIQSTFSCICGELKQKLLKISPVDLRKF